MSTLLFLTGTTSNKNTQKYDQFIPTHTNHIFNSSPRAKKRKRQASNGSSKERKRPPPLSSSSSSLLLRTSTINDMCSIYAPPSPTSSFSSSSSSSSSSTLSSPASSPLSFDSVSGDNARKLLFLDDEKRKELTKLENEMNFTQDTWATLNVMFESVRLAYLNCAPKLTSHPTRLDAMEKELLSAYDDLELQVIHLERHIQKLETSWYHYKTSNKPNYALTPPSPIV